jgi:uncharacterized BrkB/YihY/UPF0761 family membrane protein
MIITIKILLIFLVIITLKIIITIHILDKITKDDRLNNIETNNLINYYYEWLLKYLIMTLIVFFLIMYLVTQHII